IGLPANRESFLDDARRVCAGPPPPGAIVAALPPPCPDRRTPSLRRPPSPPSARGIVQHDRHDGGWALECTLIEQDALAGERVTPLQDAHRPLLLYTESPIHPDHPLLEREKRRWVQPAVTPDDRNAHRIGRQRQNHTTLRSGRIED